MLFSLAAAAVSQAKHQEQPKQKQQQQKVPVAPGPPYVRFSNVQLKSGVRTVAKTVLVENPVGVELPSLLGPGWLEAGDQAEPLNKYVNVELVGEGDGGDGSSAAVRASVLLETVTTASPFLARQMGDLAELKLNVSAAKFWWLRVFILTFFLLCRSPSPWTCPPPS